METELSQAQQAALRPEIRLIEACPGAGKTRAIVARYQSVAEQSLRGVALVSFTNAAISEANTRCGNRPHLAQAPNFIGTLDEFIRRYLVTPVVMRELGRSPRYVDSWDELPDDLKFVRHKDVGGAGLSLGSFHVNSTGVLAYPESAPLVDKRYVSELAKKGLSPSSLVQFASRRIVEYVTSGIYDPDQSRIKARSVLRDDRHAWLRSRLASRFEEIIVDEFQDCSIVDHQIIGSLESLGIRVVVVSDPDQAIYEFRHASPSSYVEYRSRLLADQTVTLSENYRSSPAICGLVSSLRSISRDPIISMRSSSPDNRHAESVYVVAGDHEFARRNFERLAGELAIEETERLVLAATRKGARELSGQFSMENYATKCSSRLVRNIAILRSGKSASMRSDAIASTEQIVLDSLRFPGNTKAATRKERIELAGLEPGQLRMIVAALVSASRDWDNSEAAVASVREVIGSELSNATIPVKQLSTRFRALETSDWSFWKKALTCAENVTSLPASHIHAVKGGEYDAVLLEIEDSPKGNREHILDLWRSPDTSEAKRVLYVGASRARRLLVLATPLRHLETLRAILEGAQLPVEYIEVDTYALIN
ncbi:UvrD-helicase domain-containing protein [Nocardia terpenica]|uniref:UvrD-helicase domain-containing protein n=1 Tax=Nocardia terpenica TaxID=455432 RepID=UPI0002D5C820|nr:UvrD-helicase domain-containing protein [Nocardia terpenica]NQE91011.1 ATP-dependent helicase [Nocardia terpenica]